MCIIFVYAIILYIKLDLQFATGLGKGHKQNIDVSEQSAAGGDHQQQVCAYLAVVCVCVVKLNTFAVTLHKL